MRLYLLGGLLCILVLQCRANPIVTITADHDSRSIEEKEIQSKGEIQEETTGVFKSDASSSAAPAENQQSDAKEETKPANSDQQAVSVSTESNDISTASVEQKNPEAEVTAKPKAKKGKVRIYFSS